MSNFRDNKVVDATECAEHQEDVCFSLWCCLVPRLPAEDNDEYYDRFSDAYIAACLDAGPAPWVVAP